MWFSACTYQLIKNEGKQEVKKWPQNEAFEDFVWDGDAGLPEDEPQVEAGGLDAVRAVSVFGKRVLKIISVFSGIQTALISVISHRWEVSASVISIQ